MDMPNLPYGISGVYEIKNVVNGHRYIGSSIDVYRRWRSHASYLNRNASECRKLQRAWNKYGEDNFAFQVISFCEPEETLALEQKALDELKPEYNLARSTTAPTLGMTYSEETRRKMSRSQSGKKNPMYGKSPSEETRQKLSDAHRGKNNSFYGKTHSEETRRRLSEIAKKRWAENPPIRTEEHNRHIGEALRGNKNSKGLKFSEEHKRKISEALKGRHVSDETRQKISEARRKSYEQKQLSAAKEALT